jgi:hypothetical protein
MRADLHGGGVVAPHGEGLPPQEADHFQKASGGGEAGAAEQDGGHAQP